MKRGILGIKVKIDDEKLIDQKINSLDDLGKIFNDVKKKLR